MGPILLRGWQESWLHGAGFLGGFYGTLVGGLALLVLVFGMAARLGPRVNRALLGASAFALTGFGLYQLWLGLAG